MHGTDPRDLAASLTSMHRTALERARWDQNECKQKMREYLAYDGRFRDYDHEALINRVQECRSNGQSSTSMTLCSKDKNRDH
jgi:hypothetical protein